MAEGVLARRSGFAQGSHSSEDMSLIRTSRLHETRTQILKALNHSLASEERSPTSHPGIQAVFCNGQQDHNRLMIIEFDEKEATESLSNAIRETRLVDDQPEITAITASPKDMAGRRMDDEPPAPEAEPNKINKIRRPVGVRRIHSWLSYFYGSTNQLHGSDSSHSSRSGNAMEDPNQPAAEINCDSPPPKANSVAAVPIARSKPKGGTSGILKPQRRIDESIQHPEPINKVEFLRREQVKRMHVLAMRVRDPQHTAARDLQESPTSLKSTSSPPPTVSGFGHRQSATVARTRNVLNRVSFDLEGTLYHETHDQIDYERGGNEYVAKSLTPEMALMIKRELNELKREMEVHEASRPNTQFYKLR